MLKINVNQCKDLMHLENNFKKSSEMLVVQKCRVSEVKLFILIYWKEVRYKFSKF